MGVGGVFVVVGDVRQRINLSDVLVHVSIIIY